MSKVLQFTKTAIVILFALFAGGKAYASHYAAADIYVDYVGTGPSDLRYKVTLVIYRACEPGNSGLGSNEYICITDTCNGVSSTFIMSQRLDSTGTNTGGFVDGLCPSFSAINSCWVSGSQWPGFQKIIYDSVITLPYRCETWQFNYNSCCRNGGILNIAPNGITVRAKINNSFRYDISTPRYYVDPVPYLCVNQPASFFNGPIDPDGDSMVTLNKWPSDGTCAANLPLTYSAGYSLTNPINSLGSNPYTVNPISGIATFTPTTIGKYVLAFQTDKYDRTTGLRIAYAQRDVQVIVLTCAAAQPKMDTLPILVSGTLGQGNVILGCPNSLITFTIGATTTSISNTLYLSADVAAATGSTFTVPTYATFPPPPNLGYQGSNAPVGTFAWTPASCDLGIHAILITATDSTCTTSQPILSKNYAVVLINVIEGINTLPKVVFTCAFNDPIQLNVYGQVGFQYAWTNITDANPNNFIMSGGTTANPTVQPKYPVKFKVTLTFPTSLPPGCKTVDYVDVSVDTSTHIKITPSTPVVLCRPGVLYLNANGTGTKPLSNLPCGAQTSIPTTALDSSDIVPGKSKLQDCSSSNPYVTPFGAYASMRHAYHLRASDLKSSGMNSGTIHSMTFKVLSFTAGSSTYDNVNVYIACVTNHPLSTASTPFFDNVIVPSPSYSYVHVVNNASITVSATGTLTIPFTTLYNWDTSQDLMIDFCYDNTGSTTPAATFMSYYNITYPGTMYYLDNAASTCNNPSAYPATYQLPQIKLNYYDAPGSLFLYTWVRGYGSQFISDSTVVNPKLWIQEDSKYYVLTKGKGGCTVGDSVSVYLDRLPPFHVRPKDTTICEGRSALLVGENATTYKWYENGFAQASSLNTNTNDKVIATPKLTTIYTAVLFDSLNCSDTFYSKVNVIPLPDFYILGPDTTVVKYGQGLQLKVSTDQYTYVWMPIHALDNPYTSNPIATPLIPTLYTVVGFNEHCAITDSVFVNVDYRSNIFVPSAFTPNRDGKNDMFRVSNITYEKIIEFRVLSRWGQEVFHATDNEGWDGTWRGVKQDMGNYYYMIRVAYPDQVVRTFEGDVTLIR